MEDDYGDNPISQAFYGGEISGDQKRIAKRARSAIEAKVGRFSTLSGLVGNKSATDDQKRRANMLFTRAISVQWIQGSASVAETSFFKINSQGTPLDETEEMLSRNRRRPIAISARAILRAGAGHKYWSMFETVQVLKNSLNVLERITGNEPKSLGLHPAVYFYNEKGKYSRFLFLGMNSSAY
jgi:hypothetical protein